MYLSARRWQGVMLWRSKTSSAEPSPSATRSAASTPAPLPACTYEDSFGCCSGNFVRSSLRNGQSGLANQFSELGREGFS